MQITLDRATLHEALESASRAVPGRPSHPILGLFHLTATPEKLIIRGFDLSLFIEREIPVIDGGDVTFTLPCKLTLDILARLTDPEVTIEVDETGDLDIAPCHTLKSGSAQTKLHAQHPTDYPEPPSLDGDADRVSFPAHVFVSACDRVAKVSSDDETMQILTGVNISGSKGKLDFAATDGHRLGYLSEDADIEFEGKTFPTRVLSEIGRLAKKVKAEEITIALTEDSLFVEFNGGRVYSRILQGNYPAYKQLIPASYKSTIEFNRKLLLSALELVAIIAEQEKKGGLIVLESKNGKLEISSTAVDLGTAKQTIDCAEDLEPIAFNVRYLLDAIRFFEDDTILMRSNTPTAPVVFTNSTTKNAQYLLMPVQLRK